jgi:lipopolysaccharide/colanic/teichoic acid biosynthesis glycosyltransferase
LFTQICSGIPSSEENHTEGLAAPLPIRSRTSLAAKRLLDVLVAAASLILLSPVLAIIALLVKLQDWGPVIHRRRVVGPAGEFDAYKFRSMRVDADLILARNPSLRDEFEKNFKLVSDPRVTRIGSWLRKLSLDELPQLLNVLRGEMSLVGPRMITAPELAKYGNAQKLLLTVKPGLTGYWQVYGRQEVAYTKRVQMDVLYIENWSLMLDLKLLALTPVRVIKGIGAY